MCTNKAGDVYVLNGGGTTIDVYAHGGTTPIRTLALPGYPELNCSVDAKTGNLALGVLGSSCGDCIAVFTNGAGIPTLYQPSGQDGLPGCAYDPQGNLFCDAYGNGNPSVFALFELPAGSSNLKSIAVSNASFSAGPMQWDGKDLAVGAGATGTIDQIAVSASTGTVVGTTQLSGTGWVWQFWLAGSHAGHKTTIIGPTYAGTSPAEAGYWEYPAGGSPTKSILTSASQPDGATVSAAK